MSNQRQADVWTPDDMLEELLPCPRCGGAAVADTGDSDGIHCDNCGYWTGDNMSRWGAIEWWNKRPLLDDLHAQIAALTQARDNLRTTMDGVEEDFEETHAAWELAIAERDALAAQVAGFAVCQQFTRADRQQKWEDVPEGDYGQWAIFADGNGVVRLTNEDGNEWINAMLPDGWRLQLRLD